MAQFLKLLACLNRQSIQRQSDKLLNEQMQFLLSGQSLLRPRQKKKVLDKFFLLLVTVSNRRRDPHSTFADTCMLFSCMFMMASEILTSIGSMTDSMLNGPSNLSATRSIASVKTQSSRSLKEEVPSGASSRPSALGSGVGMRDSGEPDCSAAPQSAGISPPSTTTATEREMETVERL